MLVLLLLLASLASPSFPIGIFSLHFGTMVLWVLWELSSDIFCSESVKVPKVESVQRVDEGTLAYCPCATLQMILSLTPLLVGFGSLAAHIITFFTGKNKCLPLMEKLSFGSYNERVANPRTPCDWLSKNELNVDMYMMDNWCGFPLTNSFFCSMTDGLIKIHKSKNIKKIPVNLPVYFIWGSDDPVGTYGKTIKELIEIYKSNGMQKLEFKEYPGDRHEILNEDNKEEVENDIINWVNKL